MSDSAVVETIGLGERGRAYLRRRYAILFYTLMSTIVAAPVFAALELPGVLIESLLAANLLAAVLPVSAGRGRGVLLGLMILVWLARSAIAWLEYPALSAMTLGIWTVIGLFAASGALRFACAQHRSTASISMRRSAPIFSREFSSAVILDPGTELAWVLRFHGWFLAHERVLFQFCHISDSGLWRYRTARRLARGLAIVEGVGGQLFLAVMVARLVSLYGRHTYID